MQSRSWKFQWSSIKDKGATPFNIGIVSQVWERHFKTSWNIKTSFNVAPFKLYVKEHDMSVVQLQHQITQI